MVLFELLLYYIYLSFVVTIPQKIIWLFIKKQKKNNKIRLPASVIFCPSQSEKKCLTCFLISVSHVLFDMVYVCCLLSSCQFNKIIFLEATKCVVTIHSEKFNKSFPVKYPVRRQNASELHCNIYPINRKQNLSLEILKMDLNMLLDV